MAPRRADDGRSPARRPLAELQNMAPATWEPRLFVPVHVRTANFRALVGSGLAVSYINRNSLREVERALSLVRTEQGEPLHNVPLRWGNHIRMVDFRIGTRLMHDMVLGADALHAFGVTLDFLHNTYYFQDDPQEQYPF